MATCYASPYFTDPVPFHRCSIKNSQELSPSNSDSSLTSALKRTKLASPEDEMMTPPEDERPVRKTSVTFSLPEDASASSESEPEYLDWSPTMSCSDASSPVSDFDLPSFGICGQRLSNETLVALYDRSVEMRELIERNHEFFSSIRTMINRRAGEWEKFMKLLLSEREEMADREWIQNVQKVIGDIPVIFGKFKQIVGYEDEIYTNKKTPYRYRGGYDDDDDEDEDGYLADDREEDDRSSDDSFNYVNLTLIRRYPSRLAIFEKQYPQLFINARRCLCAARGPHGISSSMRGDDDSEVEVELEPHTVIPTGRVEQSCCSEDEQLLPFEEFKRILFAPRRLMMDEQWEQTLLECLDGWPDLLAQLKEIVAFEVEDAWGEEEDDDEDM